MTRPPKRRHVWVDSSGGYRHPGLVIAWRRADGTATWEAYVARAPGDGTALATWEPATSVHPITDDGWALRPPTQ